MAQTQIQSPEVCMSPLNNNCEPSDVDSSKASPCSDHELKVSSDLKEITLQTPEASDDAEMETRLVNEYLRSSTKEIYTEWTEPLNESSQGSKPSKNSYYMIMNATRNFEIGCAFPGGHKFTSKGFTGTLSKAHSQDEDGTKGSEISTWRYYDKTMHSKKPKFEHDGEIFKFFNVIAPETVLNYQVKADGYGELVDVVSCVEYRCGIACLKYQEGEIYLFMADKDTLQSESWSNLSEEFNKIRSEHMSDILKNVLTTANKIKTHGLDAGFRCYFPALVSHPYKSTFYLVNTGEIKSFTKITLYFFLRLQEIYFHVCFQNNNMFALMDWHGFEGDFGLEEFQPEATVEDFERGTLIDGEKYLNVLECSPDSVPHHMIFKSSGDLEIDLVSESSYGYVSHCRFLNEDEVLEVKFVAPDGLKIPEATTHTPQ